MARVKQSKGKAPSKKAAVSASTVRRVASGAKNANSSSRKAQKTLYDEDSLQWVLTTVSGYVPDGFHTSEPPEREVSALKGVGPTDREQAIVRLQEKVGEAFAGWAWDEVEERSDVQVMADEPGRCGAGVSCSCRWFP
jgi:hypothetical protein